MRLTYVKCVFLPLGVKCEEAATFRHEIYAIGVVLHGFVEGDNEWKCIYYEKHVVVFSNLHSVLTVSVKDVKSNTWSVTVTAT